MFYTFKKNTKLSSGFFIPFLERRSGDLGPSLVLRGRDPAFVRPLPARPRGPSYLDRASPEAVDFVGIRTGFQELSHGLHLPPRCSAGQSRIAAAAAEHALVLFPHFASPRVN